MKTEADEGSAISEVVCSSEGGQPPGRRRQRSSTNRLRANRNTRARRHTLAGGGAHKASRGQGYGPVDRDDGGGLTRLGRYPFTCCYRRYLRGARGRLSESTIRERERKLHFLSRLVRGLVDAENVSSTNPAKFTEDDIVEIYLALKGRGIANETLRKHISMLKSVTRESRNPVVDDMLAKGKIVIGRDHREPFSLEMDEVETLLESVKKVGGWRGAVSRFSIAMMTFLRLRPGELQKARVGDLNTKKWTFFIANPKGKGLYGQEAVLPVPDVLKPYVIEFLEERDKMLRSKGIAEADALIPAIARGRAGFYTQQAFGRLKDPLIAKTGIYFRWKDFRSTGGQIALDHGVHIEQVSRSMRHSSVTTTERYYCRARADLAFARVNEAYNRAFRREPAIDEETV